MDNKIIELCNKVANGEVTIDENLDTTNCDGIGCAECPFSSYFNNGTCGFADVDYKFVAFRYLSKYYGDNYDIKSFTQLIQDIKRGEVWDSENWIISLNEDNEIEIEHKDGFENCDSIYINRNCMFKRKKEELIFDKAFEAYQSGLEIISIETKRRYKIVNDNLDAYYSTEFDNWMKFNGGEGFSPKEIQGKWYVKED